MIPDVGGCPHGLPPGQSNLDGGLPRVSTIPLVTVTASVYNAQEDENDVYVHSNQPIHGCDRER